MAVAARVRPQERWSSGDDFNYVLELVEDKIRQPFDSGRKRSSYVELISP